MLPLATVASIEARRGIDAIRHHDTRRTLTIRGDVDFNVVSGGEVIAYFNEHMKERVAREYGVSAGLDELSLAEDQAASDFLIQFPIALALIYMVLAWVFASWSWPLAVMAAIPLGLTGALMGQKLLVRADALQNGTRILVSQLSNAVTGLRVSTAGRIDTLAGPDASGDVAFKADSGANAHAQHGECRTSALGDVMQKEVSMSHKSGSPDRLS